MADLGPQNPRDSPFAARMRLHQSWYRALVMKASFGTGPKPGNKTYYGNMLTREDGERGLNFLTPHIFKIAKRRLAEKKGIADPFRLLCDLTSSQAMCLNLIGPLVDNWELAGDLFRALVPGQVGRVQRVRLFYTPEPAREYLNDLSGFDVLIEYDQPEGRPAFIGIGLQLPERLEAKATIQPAYWKWTKREGSPWPEAAWPRLIEPDVNFLWRGHLLEEAMTRRPGTRYAAGRFLVLYHPFDEASIRSIEAYQRLLKPGEPSFSALPLDTLIGRWRAAVTRETDRDWLEGFDRRYLDFPASEQNED